MKADAEAKLERFCEAYKFEKEDVLEALVVEALPEPSETIALGLPLAIHIYAGDRKAERLVKKVKGTK